MSVSNITAVQSNTSLPNVERINRINANNREISALENQIAGQKEVSAAAKELINNNSKSTNLTKEIITDTKKLIDIKKEMISNNEALISSGNRKIDILEQLKDSSDRLIGIHQGQRGLLQESRDLTKESRDLTQGMIDTMEKMIAIMMKNPAKYGGLGNDELQKLPEIKEVKSEVVATALVKVEQYPKKEHAALTQTVKNVVDATFSEVEPNDMKANRELFNNLGQRIEVAIEDKHKTLMFYDREHEAFNINENNVSQSKNRSYAGLEKFSRINRLDYLDLAIKNIKV